MNTAASPFSSAVVLANLARLPRPQKYWVGFSGGADSTALLQALFECREELAAPLHAIHFHHGLQAEATAWQEHCAAFCREREIPFHTETLDVPGEGVGNLEEESRNARYRVVGRILGHDDMYLTAHHAEDQAETLFLNLMRGSGVEGLAGIPALRNLEHGWVARPLLDQRRPDLEAFLEERGIEWLTDPSNADTRFDRNYLRQELFPLLEQRWPGLTGRLLRTSRNARMTASAMAVFIESQSGHLIHDRLKMPLHKLLELDPEMQALILRQWLRRHEVPVLPEARLKEFLDQLSVGRMGSKAEVQWDDWMIKRYQLDLWLHRRSPFEPCPETAWRDGMEVDLGEAIGRVRLVGDPARIPADWVVRARRPGDRIRTLPAGPSRKVKQFFQTASIPPWLRAGIPVLEWDGEPVALGDWVFGHRLKMWLVEHGVSYIWQPNDPVLARLRSDNQR